MILPALLLLMQDAAMAATINQMEQRFAACGFPGARITLNEEMQTAAVTLSPQNTPSDGELDCAAKLMVRAHLFPGTDTPALAERLRPFLLRAMQGNQDEDRQALIERDALGPAVASLTPLRGNPAALKTRLTALCGPESRKLIRVTTPPGAPHPLLELHPALRPGEATAAVDKAFLCIVELSTAADLGLGFVGNAAAPKAPLPSTHPAR
jgi:hypothetical protein